MNIVEKKIYEIVKSSKNNLNHKDIYNKAKINPSQSKAFYNTLDSMVRNGVLEKKSGKFAAVIKTKKGQVSAEIVKVNNTFAFASPETEGDDIFIPGKFLKGALPGDKVLLEVNKSATGGLMEGKVVDVTAQENRTFSATIECSAKGGYTITPDRYVRFPFEIPQKHLNGAKEGDKVLAVVEKRGERHSEHKVRILEVFGSAESALNNSYAILAENGIEIEFDTNVLEEAKRIGEMGIHPKEIEKRVDLRDKLIFTIDGADTKDIDDAISIDVHGDGWTLGVHIADVTYYVLPNSPIDKEAYNRGTSVYYANKVVPMLPKELSNGICSLNPNEDRLAFSAFLEISQNGQLKGYKFEKTVIKSKIQGVYSEINDILKGEESPEIKEKYKELESSVWELKKLANALNNARMSRGGIRLHSTESKIIVDKNDKAVDIIQRQEGESEGFIEEFMLMANQAAATFGLKETLPFLFRVHENPDPERLELLYTFLDSLGIRYRRTKDEDELSNELNKVLENVKDTPMQAVVNNMILRTMAKARYSSESLGHFGLGLKNYSHFTSPIRRYPDLAIHRILTGLLTGMRRETIDKSFGTWVGDCARQSSNREISAQSAERSCEDCYKAEYMAPFVGQEFEGRVAGATSFGAFVQLPNTVEGMVAIEDFPTGEWAFDKIITFNNRVGGAKIKLGDKVKVKLVKTDIAAGRIDFVFV